MSCVFSRRLILTKDQTEIHRLCMDVLKQTIMAVQEQLVAFKKSKFKGNFNNKIVRFCV